MKNLKCLILSVFLAVNLFCIPTSTAKEYNSSEEAKGLVETLALMPNKNETADTVTRGEFAYAVTRLLNIDAVNAGVKSGFYDISGNEWEPYISALHTYGVVEGCRGNVFEPERAVTEYESVKILMRALGYTYIAEAQGASPAVYLQEASDSGLTRGIPVSYTNELTYEKCTELLFNALSVPVAEQVDFGENISFKTAKNKTAMSTYHDLYKDTGRITTVGVKSVKFNEKTSKNKAVIDSETYINEFENAETYLGMKVKYYYKDSGKDDKKLVFAVPATGVEVITIDAEDILSVKNKTISYRDKNDRTRTEKIELACDVTKNGSALETISEADFNLKNGEIILIDNDGTGNADTVFIKSYVNYIVDSAEVDNGKLKIKPQYNMPWFETDTQRMGFSVTVKTSDGKIADISDIENGTVISVSADKTKLSPSGKEIADGEGHCFEIYVSSKQITGEYTAKTETSVIVDGVEYETAYSNYLDETKIDFGSKVTLLLDRFGKATAWKLEEETAEKDFGYLIYAKITDDMESVMEAKLMNASGDITVRKINEKCRLNDKRIKNFKTLITSLYESARHANPQKNDMTQLIKYSENANGEIDNIETTLCEFGVPQGEDKNHLRISGSKMKLSRKGGDNFWDLNTGLTGCVVKGSTKYYVVPMTDYDGEDDNFRKINVNDTTWQLYEAYAKTCDLYNFDDTIVPEVVVIYGATEDEAIEEWVMVDKTEDVLGEDGTAEKRIKVVSGQNGVKSIPIEYPEKFADIKQGDVITIYGRNDKARSYTMHMTLEKAKQYARIYKHSASDTLSVSDPTMTSFGEVYAVGSKSIKMQCGAYKVGTSTNEREMQWGALYSDSKDYFEYGAVTYDAESGKPKIEKTQKNKIVSAISNPENPDLVYVYYHSGQPKSMIFYRGLDTE